MKNTTKKKLFLSFWAAVIGMLILWATVMFMHFLFEYSIMAAFAFVFVVVFLCLWCDVYKYLNKEDE